MSNTVQPINSVVLNGAITSNHLAPPDVIGRSLVDIDTAIGYVNADQANLTVRMQTDAIHFLTVYEQFDRDRHGIVPTVRKINTVPDPFWTVDFSRHAAYLKTSDPINVAGDYKTAIFNVTFFDDHINLSVSMYRNDNVNRNSDWHVRVNFELEDLNMNKFFEQVADYMTSSKYLDIDHRFWIETMLENFEHCYDCH
jgi:hypothetical protein